MTGAGDALISIVVPVFNEATVLSTLLRQLREIPGPCEIIVVDGGSTDETLACARELADRSLVSPVAGRAVQMNRGAAEAQGAILWFVHADSTLLGDPQAYRQVLSAGATWGFFPLRLAGSMPVFRILERAINWRSRLSSVATGDQGIFVRRKHFLLLKGFAEQPLMEDVELCKRLRRQARPLVAGLPLQTASRRWEHYGVVRTVVLMWRLRLLYFLGVSAQRLAAKYPRQGA